MPVGRFVVRHAAAGGEPARWNIRDFDFQTGLDGTAWTTVASVRGNAADVTINRTDARFLRLSLITPPRTPSHLRVGGIYQLVPADRRRTQKASDIRLRP
jgi:glycoprotein endo-alpha-1,2-mannosidase